MTLVGGYRIIYEREALLEIKITDPHIIAMVGQEVGSKELVTFKILMKGPSEEYPEVFKIELSSDHDYFFLYRHM